MSSQDSPNIIFIVLDAARVDYLAEHTEFLSRYRKDNIWFENAIAPSTWSLPSHPSLFTGDLPHEHGVYRVTRQRMDELPLVDQFNDAGYTTMAVSANGFASPRTGFHLPFDEFRYTSDWGPFPDGLNVTQHAFELREREQQISTKKLVKASLRATSRHQHPIKSACNFGVVALNRLSSRLPLAHRLPHPLFNTYSQYSYSPARNTSQILSLFSKSSPPFFLFANYMDTHRPYNPPKQFRGALSKNLSYNQIARLNRIAAPWEYIRRTETGESLDNEIEVIRDLYAGEVRSVDHHIESIIEALDRRGIRENTLVVITSDHGENLGEVDLFGNRRIGHESSLSRPLLRVPLLVAHPELSGENVTPTVSSRCIFDLLKQVINNDGKITNYDVTEAFSTSSPTIAEYPATRGEELAEQYPEVSDESIRLRTEVHFVVGFFEGWLVIVGSNGRRMAWNKSTKVQYEESPEEIRKSCEKSLTALKSQDNQERKLSDKEQSHLKDLGYL